MLDLNKKYGKLRILKLFKINKKSLKNIYECRCDCGNICNASEKALKYGEKLSCGCLRQENKNKDYFKNLEKQGILTSEHLEAIDIFITYYYQQFEVDCKAIDYSKLNIQGGKAREKATRLVFLRSRFDKMKEYIKSKLDTNVYWGIDILIAMLINKLTIEDIMRITNEEEKLIIDKIEKVLITIYNYK